MSEVLVVKASNIIVAVLLLALCIAGWATLASQKNGETEQKNKYLELADSFQSRGLYQRAAENYLAAMDVTADEELYVKAVNAYEQRYIQAPQEVREQYLDLLGEAATAFPANTEILRKLIPLYREDEDYRHLYSRLDAALKAGCEDSDIMKAYLDTRYSWELRGSYFQELHDSGLNGYVVLRNDGWNIYSPSSGYVFPDELDFAGPMNADGVAVICSDRPMIFSTGDNKVLGLFKDEIRYAGILSEGLVAVKIGDEIGYYDEYGEYRFGGYDFAGTFQDGLAAVKNGEKWSVIDKTGNVVSDGFDEIVLDRQGRCVLDGKVLVRDKETYTLYDDDWKELWSLMCDQMDVRTPDDLTACELDGRWGFVDDGGSMVIEPQYAGAKSFSNGLAAVMDTQGLWGFIDREGRVVIDFQFSDAGYMDGDGICPVSVENSKDMENPTIEWTFLRLQLGITGD